MNSVTFWITIAGGLIELAVAVLAIIDLRGEDLPKEKEKKIERYVAILAVIAAACTFAAMLTAHRAESLEDVENLKERVALSNKLSTIDPRNLRANDISAKVSFELTGEMVGVPNIPSTGVYYDSFVSFRESDAPPNKLSLGAFSILYVRDVEPHETKSDGPTTHGYKMNIVRDYGTHGDIVSAHDNSPATPKMIEDWIIWAQLQLPFVAPNSEILSGDLELLINGTFKKKFSIPRQICSTNGTFFATNSIP